jgi:hypothetical protein
MASWLIIRVAHSLRPAPFLFRLREPQTGRRTKMGRDAKKLGNPSEKFQFELVNIEFFVVEVRRQNHG